MIPIDLVWCFSSPWETPPESINPFDELLLCWKNGEVVLGWDERIVFTSASWPDVERILPFQPGSRSPILSINGCNSTLRSFLVSRGNQIFSRELAYLSREILDELSDHAIF